MKGLFAFISLLVVFCFNCGPHYNYTPDLDGCSSGVEITRNGSQYLCIRSVTECDINETMDHVCRDVPVYEVKIVTDKQGQKKKTRERVGSEEHCEWEDVYKKVCKTTCNPNYPELCPSFNSRGARTGWIQLKN
ncbi:hypothetical protein HQ571_02390 [Candidatus Kuenenbacteria bacterium]|nr:hypothetical protein [Candidatus Kuenenbacteria bacterium]